MQVVILCGGRGTRLGPESEVRPKSMVEIGGRPIIWHIMKSFAHQGHKEFILCLGYLGEAIKHYFLHYEALNNDIVIEPGPEGTVRSLSSHDEQDWRITLTDTGLTANTGARVKRVEKHLAGDDFLLTYGDGVSDVDLPGLIEFHRGHGKLCTVTAVHPPARFGELALDQGKVTLFSEKPQTSAGLINGGFMVVKREALERMGTEDSYSLEHQFLRDLAEAGELMAFAHDGFWQCVDTVRELMVLRDLWETGRAAWRVW